MSLSRVFLLTKKDFKLCPRSPVAFWILLMPLFITFFIQVVFPSIFEEEPVLGVSACSESIIAANLATIDCINIVFEGEDDLADMVRRGSVDAGLFISDTFEDSVISGERPELRFSASEKGNQTNSGILLLVIMDELRNLEGRDIPVSVSIRTPDFTEQAPLSERIVPSMILIVMMVSGVFIPAFMLVQERERGTLSALLSTPTSIKEVLFAKGLLGFCLTIPITFITLAMNGIRGFDVFAMLVCFAVGTVVCNSIGLIYGTLARDTKSLYTMVKSLNIILAAPVLFYIFPGWPGWVAKIFPTYWFMDPIYRVAMKGASLPDVIAELAAAVFFTILLVFCALHLGRRMQRRLAEK